MRTLGRPGFEWPPVERLPEHIQAAIAAQEAQRPLTPEEVEALVELTSWAFNGVSAGDPRFEEQFAAWCREATAHHAQRLLRGLSG
jgi:hypothetical protein